jgi:hypothetical protein
LNAGIVAASVYNASPARDPKGDPVSPLEFVPELKKALDDSRDLRKMTPEEQRDYMLAIFGKRVFQHKK